MSLIYHPPYVPSWQERCDPSMQSGCGSSMNIHGEKLIPITITLAFHQYFISQKIQRQVLKRVCRTWNCTWTTRIDIFHLFPKTFWCGSGPCAKHIPIGWATPFLNMCTSLLSFLDCFHHLLKRERNQQQRLNKMSRLRRFSASKSDPFPQQHLDKL